MNAQTTAYKVVGLDADWGESPGNARPHAHRPISDPGKLSWSVEDVPVSIAAIPESRDRMSEQHADADIPQTVAAVDLGSNSFHIIVGKLDNKQLVILDRLRDAVRLGGACWRTRPSVTMPGNVRSTACRAWASACARYHLTRYAPWEPIPCGRFATAAHF